MLVRLCGAVLGFFLVAWLLQFAWNFVVPALFGGPAITFWQTCALWILIGALTGKPKA